MISLIDADIVAYRCAAVTKDEPESTALFQTEQMIKRILEETKATSYMSFISGTNNFRYDVNPEYKANRKDVEKPKHLNICKDFIVKYYNGIVTEGHEADDALGMYQCNAPGRAVYIQGEVSTDTVICSIDKDMLMIPGLHYNFVKNEWYNINELEAIKQLYRQLIIGDNADNIFGVKGVGKVGASKAIDHLDTEEDMIDTVLTMYDNDFDRFKMNADCLWIWRNLDEKYSDRGDLPIWLKMMLLETDSSPNQLMTSIVMDTTEFLDDHISVTV